MKKLLVIAFALAASPCLAQDVTFNAKGEIIDPIAQASRLVLIESEQPSPWPLTMRLERPHSDETPVCDASAALARWAPEEPRERHHRRWRHRVARRHR